MTQQKLHHYVPQFYLLRFSNSAGQLWVWDRDRNHVFLTHRKNVAVEQHFYRLTELVEHGHDPLPMEKQFCALEDEMATITNQWLDWLRKVNAGDQIPIPAPNRELVSLYIALQYLRTAESRELLAAISGESGLPVSGDEKRHLHTEMLWDDRIFRNLAERVEGATWVFARNPTDIPFVTSDNPVAFRTSDNRMWRKLGYSSTYVVFPLAPDIIMYCYPKASPWEQVAKFDCALSPVTLTDNMVKSENSGQVFMASRFVISSRNNFDWEREFAKSIGTDLHAATSSSEA